MKKETEERETLSPSPPSPLFPLSLSLTGVRPRHGDVIRRTSVVVPAMNALVFKRSGHRERGKIDETERRAIVPRGREREAGRRVPKGGIAGRREDTGEMYQVWDGEPGETGGIREREDIFARGEWEGEGG